MLKDFLKRRVYNATGLLPLLFLLAACSALKPVDKVDRWEAYLYDVQRTNHAQAGLPVPLKTSWTRDISPFIILHRYPEEQASSPVLSGGALFIGSVNGRFYAFDARSGSLLWKFDSGYPVEAAAASDNGAVCFGSSGGVLRCLKAEDGTLVWIYQMKSEITSSPLIKDGRIYVSSADDRLTALDLKTGERIWSYSRSTFASVAPRIKASPALSPAMDAIYQLFSDGSLVGLSMSTGKELWSQKVVKGFNSPNAARRTPLVSGGTVYIIADNGAVMSFNAGDGKVKGIYSTIKAVDFIVHDDKILVMAGTDDAVAIDISTGALLWKQGLRYGPASSVFAADERLFVVANHTHAPLGINFLASTKAYIQALNLKSGEFEWGAKIGSSTAGGNASAAAERAALLLNDGRLVVLAPETGMPLPGRGD